MKTKKSYWSWDVAMITAIVLVAGLCAQAQQAVRADDQTEPEGRIVQIAPDAEGSIQAEEITKETPVASQPAYWIGFRGRRVESPVLRTQLQLAEDLGVVVEDVVPDSPAEKAGLRKHDVLLRANGEPIHGMRVLQKLVSAGQAKPIELTLIRLGQETTVTVVPEKQPESFAIHHPGGQGDLPLGAFGGRTDALRKLIEQLQGEGGLPEGLRALGPDKMLESDEFNLNNLPNGVSVTITRSNDGPSKISVKQGDKTWNFEGDDAKSLKQLPEELRPFVKQLLQGQDPAGPRGLAPFNFQAELEHLLPGRLGDFARGVGQNAARDPVLQRMDQLEQQLEELQKKLDAEDESR